MVGLNRCRTKINFANFNARKIDFEGDKDWIMWNIEASLYITNNMRRKHCKENSECYSGSTIDGMPLGLDIKASLPPTDISNLTMESSTADRALKLSNLMEWQGGKKPSCSFNAGDLHLGQENIASVPPRDNNNQILGSSIPGKTRKSGEMGWQGGLQENKYQSWMEAMDSCSVFSLESDGLEYGTLGETEASDHEKGKQSILSRA